MKQDKYYNFLQGVKKLVDTEIMKECKELFNPFPKYEKETETKKYLVTVKTKLGIYNIQITKIS